MSQEEDLTQSLPLRLVVWAWRVLSTSRPVTAAINSCQERGMSCRCWGNWRTWEESLSKALLKQGKHLRGHSISSPGGGWPFATQKINYENRAIDGAWMEKSRFSGTNSLVLSSRNIFSCNIEPKNSCWRVGDLFTHLVQLWYVSLSTGAKLLTVIYIYIYIYFRNTSTLWWNAIRLAKKMRKKINWAKY